MHLDLYVKFVGKLHTDLDPYVTIYGFRSVGNKSVCNYIWI